MIVNLSEASRKILIGLVLAIATLAVFWQVNHFDFVNLDDKMYIHENRHVLSGLTVENVTWAFTSFYASNWHPLTWLSHMLDVGLFGVNAGRFHLVNVFFHIFNTLLLFLIIDRMAGALWKSAFFWMLTLGAYILHYVPTLKPNIPQ